MTQVEICIIPEGNKLSFHLKGLNTPEPSFTVSLEDWNKYLDARKNLREIEQRLENIARVQLKVGTKFKIKHRKLHRPKA